MARGPRVRLDARVRARVGDRRDRGHRPPPAPEPRRHDLRGARAAAARQRIDGADAGDVLGSPLAAGRAALRLAGQASGRAVADDRGRRPPRDPVHHGHPRGDRRGRAGTRRVRVRDPRPPPALRAHPRGDRAELPREARHRDGRRTGTGCRRVPRRGGDDEDRARSARERAGSSEPLGPSPAAPLARRRHQRLGRGLAAHARPREPRAALAGDRGARGDDRRARQDAPRAPHDLPALRARPPPFDRGQDAAPGRCAPRRRRARARRHGSGAGPVAGPGCHVEAADDRSHVREGSRGRSAGGRRRRLR